MRRRQSLVLLAVSIAILAAGALIRRRPVAPQAAPPISPAPDLERLQRLTAERRLRDLSDFLKDAAGNASRRLLSPSGLVWDASVVLAPPAPPRPYTVAAVAWGGRPVALVRAHSPAGIPFSIWSAAAGAGLPRAASVTPKSGDWVLAVARDSAGQPVFAHGLFQGVRRQTCGGFEYDELEFDAVLSPILIGGGIFALDGAVAGFVGDCEGRPIPIAASTISAVISRPVAAADVLEQRYGYRLSGDTVISVWQNSPAEAAGLRPGDVVDPQAERPPTAKRGARTVKLAWPGDEPAPPAPPIRGITFEGATVAAVAPDSAAASAGILPGDVVIAPRDPAGALERARGPVVLTVERRGRRVEILIRP